jgi:hypothetical protein
MLISNPLKKVQKMHAKKVLNKKGTEKNIFFNRFELGIKFCIF